MKKLVFFFFLVFGFSSFAQWTVKNAFAPKVFIENKGQYNLHEDGLKGEILFSANQDGLQYFFTKSAIWIKYASTQKRTEHEIEKLKEKLGIKENEGKEEKEFAVKIVNQFHVIEFVNGGNNTTIESQGLVNQLYNFGTQTNRTISAKAFKKITYKNLYPGIDMEFYFPDDKQGFKYNFILAAGANANQIQIRFPEAGKIKLDEQGNLIITSIFGNFIDHAPSTQDLTGKKINCAFKLKKNIVTFDMSSLTNSNGLIIDPWTTTPSFTGSSNAYDVDWDNFGNCYVYGGPMTSYQVIKFNAAGTLVWSFTPAIACLFYGDFAVDRRTGSVYIAEAYNNSSNVKVIKTNANGVQVGTYSAPVTIDELWRIAINPCLNLLVIAGGGDQSPYYTGCTLDTNLANFAGANILGVMNPWHDMWGLALDNVGNSYMIAALSLSGTSQCNNYLFKSPLPALTPNSFSVTTNYQFLEARSEMYNPVTYAGGGAYANGYNGMVVSDTSLYTWDSYVFKKWSTNNGTLINSSAINGASQVHVLSGGITADNCDHVFLGDQNSIKQYDGLTSTLVNTISATSTVYDVSLGNNNILYACGNGFVSAFQVNLPVCISSPLTLTTQVTNPSCGSANGSATVTIAGGTAPYTTTWNTNPVQTGTVATNLVGGSYVVTVTDKSCPPLVISNTITISPAVTSFSFNTTTQTVTCFNANNGSATVNIVGGTGPFGVLWSNSQTGLNAINLSAGTYTVHVADITTHCVDSATVSITQPQQLIVNAPNGSICSGQTYTLYAAALGGTTPYTYNWDHSASATNPFIISPTITSTYTLVVTDANGCTAGDSSITISVSPPLNVTIGDTSICAGNSIIFTAYATGGSGNYTYNWLPGNLNTNIILTSPASTTIYTVTVNDGCTPNPATDTGKISVTSFTFNITSQAINCFGANNGNATVNIIGGVGPFAVLWSNAQTGVKDSLLSVGTYSVHVADLTTNCANTATVLITQPQQLNVNVTNGFICSGQTYTLNATASGGITPYTYSWNNGASTANPFIVSPAATSTYTILVADANGCKATDSLITLTVHPPPQITVGDTGICAGNQITLTAHATGGVGIYSYNWMPGNLSGSSISVSPTSTTIYTVTLNDGCVTSPVTDTGKVSVVAPPLITMPNSVAGCAPLYVSFTNPPGLVTWQWNFGDNTTTPYANPIHLYQHSGTFYPSITYTATTGCISNYVSTNTITVFAISHTPFIASPNPTDILNPQVSFTNQFINSSSWQWLFGDGTSSNLQNPNHIYQQPGIYTVTLIGKNQQGCNDTVREQIIISDIFTFYAPNAFTPNGDIFNEKFLPLGEGWDNTTYHLWIYDRWGNLIFKTQDTTKGWDGKVNDKGGIAQEDVYVWKVQLNDIFKKHHQFSGTITLAK